MIKIIPRLATFAAGFALATSPLALPPSFAQDHSQMHHEQDAIPAKGKAKVKKPARKTKVTSGTSRTEHGKNSGIDLGEHGAGGAHGGHEMKGFLGPYGMGREGSGTSWASTLNTGTG